MDGNESRRLGAHRSSVNPPATVDLSDPPDEDHAGLDDVATQWAESLLEVARFELARADDKANTLFRFYGVVAALSIGLLAGSTASPTNLAIVPQLFFWAGCAAFLASGVYLGMTLYPRDIRGAPAHRLLYFGHVIEYQSVDELAAGLQHVKADSGRRIVEQLLSVSRLVHAKYALTRKALIALGVGTLLCIWAVLLNVIIAHL